MRGQIGAEEEQGGVPDAAGRGRSACRSLVATGGTGERGGGMDDRRFARLQERFCGLPEGQAPNLDGLPDRFLQRLRAEDGTVDPARLAEAQDRICSADGPPARGAEFAQLRERFCAAPEGTIPDLTGLPERLLERLRGEDGEIDPERVAQARERFCGEEARRSVHRQGRQRCRTCHRMPGRGDGPRRPRFFLNLSHSVELENTILVAEGGPVLDQLDGDATSTFGLPRHSTTLEGGLFLDGIGVRASANYLGSTRLSGSGLPGSSDLFIDDLATLDLRLFMNLGEVIGPDDGLLKDLRLSLRADNVFDGQRAVRTGTASSAALPAPADRSGRALPRRGAAQAVLAIGRAPPPICCRDGE